MCRNYLLYTYFKPIDRQFRISVCHFIIILLSFLNRPVEPDPMAKDFSSTHTHTHAICNFFSKIVFSSSVGTSPLSFHRHKIDAYYKIIIIIIAGCRLVWGDRKMIESRLAISLGCNRNPSSVLRGSVDLTCHNRLLCYRYYRFGIAFHVPLPFEVPRCCFGCIHVEFTAQRICRRI